MGVTYELLLGAVVLQSRRDRLPLPPAGGPEHTDLPAIASAGALLSTSSSAAAGSASSIDVV